MYRALSQCCGSSGDSKTGSAKQEPRSPDIPAHKLPLVESIQIVSHRTLHRQRLLKRNSRSRTGSIIVTVGATPVKCRRSCGNIGASFSREEQQLDERSESLRVDEAPRRFASW